MTQCGKDPPDNQRRHENHDQQRDAWRGQRKEEPRDARENQDRDGKHNERFEDDRIRFRALFADKYRQINILDDAFIGPEGLKVGNEAIPDQRENTARDPGILPGKRETGIFPVKAQQDKRHDIDKKHVPFILIADEG